MCGVIGYKPLKPNDLQAFMFKRLFDESRIRGHHAYGLANPSATFKSFDWEEVVEQFDPSQPTIGHTRYCQSGDWKVMENNQPLVVGNLKLAMNGVLHMGTKEEFEKAFDVHCLVDNDSEIFLQKISTGVKPRDFITSITGSFSATWLEGDRLWAGRNARRPLWRCKAFDAWWYASTRDIFIRAAFREPTELPYPHVEYLLSTRQSND